MEWISVKDRLPELINKKELSVKVLVCVDGEVDTADFYEITKSFCWYVGYGYEECFPTDWMPLPNPPTLEP